jgi:hypothetical protein
MLIIGAGEFDERKLQEMISDRCSAGHCIDPETAKIG